jgi:enoyl-CoA hydratase
MSIDVERDGGIAVVTINRPDALNALDVAHAEELRERLGEAASDGETRVVVLTGAGDRAFVAGADIRYMQDLPVLEARRWGELGQACANLLETMPKPTIAAVNGFALGGGCELALACDLRFASTAAKLGQPEINLGIIPGWGGTQRLARIAGVGVAKDLVLTGRNVGAEEALRLGLVSAIYEPDELMPRVLGVARGLAEKSAVALAFAKEALNLVSLGEARAHLETEERLFAMLFASEDQSEGMAAFVEKRKPSFRGK